MRPMPGSWALIAAIATRRWRNPGFRTSRPASTCMNCHNQVLKDDPRLALVRESAAERQADSLGADSQRAGLRLLQPFRPREPRHQLRGMPRADQPDGRSLSRQAVEHDVLPGLPSQPGRQTAPAGQDHRPELDGPDPPENATANSAGKNHARLARRIPAKLLRLSPMKKPNASANSTVLSPATGRRYWRSLDELADTPEFRRMARTRIPAGRERIGSTRCRAGTS